MYIIEDLLERPTTFIDVEEHELYKAIIGVTSCVAKKYLKRKEDSSISTLSWKAL